MVRLSKIYCFFFLLFFLSVSCVQEEMKMNSSEEEIMTVSKEFSWSASKTTNWLIKISSENLIDNYIGYLKSGEVVFASAKMKNNSFSFSAKVPIDLENVEFECKACGISNRKISKNGGAYEFLNFSSNKRIATSVDTVYNSVDTQGGDLTVNGINIGLMATNYNKIILKNGAKVVFLTTTTVQKLLTNGSSKNDVVIASDGNFTLNQGYSDNKIDITNYGTTYIKGTAVFSQSAHLNNQTSGTFTVKDQLNNNSSIENHGTLYVGKSFHNNGSATLENTCQIQVEEAFHQNNTFTNNGYVNVKGNATFNGGSSTTMGANSYIYCESNYTLNGNISTLGDALINVDNNINLGGGVGITGVKFSTPSNNFKNNNSGISDNSLLLNYNDAMNDIQSQGNCGYGYNLSQDPYTLRYPSNGEVTIVFEDMWPQEGDYDFNDLIITYSILYSIDENNYITSMVIDGEYKAWGGFIKNGVALRWLVNKQVSNSDYFESSDIVEEGSSNVIILTNNISNEISNIHNGGALPLVKSYSKTINFENGIDASIISDFTLDPFLYNIANRGIEIHLPNYPSTSLCDNSIFNTFDDNSDQSTIWYKTSTNMPWGIELLTGGEQYKVPKEGINIKNAYPSFQSWVVTDGSSGETWYSSPELEKVYND